MTEKTLSFEESMRELQEIVKSLESGGQDLDTSIKSYTKGMELKKLCEKKLTEARLTVEKIQQQ